MGQVLCIESCPNHQRQSPQEEWRDVASGTSMNNMDDGPTLQPSRAFGATTFEEEKAALIKWCTPVRKDDPTQASTCYKELDKNASREALNDEEIALACVKVQGNFLSDFKEKPKASKPVVLAAVANDGWTLVAASQELRADKEVVLTAINTSPHSIRYASDELRADREVVLAALRDSDSGDTLQFASEELRNDKQIVLKAVNLSGSALEFASKKLRADKEVVMAAVRNDGSCLERSSTQLQLDKEVVLAAVSNNGEVFRYGHANDKFKADKEVVLAAVRNNGTVIYKASEKLQADREVIFAAINNTGKALGFMSDELKADREVAYYAVKNNAKESLWAVGPSLRGDKDYMLMLARTGAPPTDVYDRVAEELKEGLSEDNFCLAAESAISIPGQFESDPTVLVTLTNKGDSFHAEGTFGLSGEKIACDIKSRGDATKVDELAKELVTKLQQAGKMNEEQKRIFINFQKKGSQTPTAVTPWDSQRPLSQFLSTNA